jgi:CIC family chloride channel protein
MAMGEDDDAVVAGEIRDFLRAQEQRRRTAPRAILAGALTGLVAVAFAELLDAGERLRAAVIGAGGFTSLVGSMALGAVGAGIAVSLVRAVAPETAGSGIPHLKAVLHNLRALRWPRVLLVKFVGGIAAIGGGLTLGREGPTVQMGGAVGQMVSGWFPCTPRERQSLIAAGAGAGLAAAFNAPLSGLVFVLEEVQRDFAPTIFTAVLIASVAADVVVRLLTGQVPVFHVVTHATPSLASLPAALVIGALAGVLGVAFNRWLVRSLDLFQRLSTWPAWAVGGVTGAAIGLVGWLVPDVLGGGERLVQRTLAGEVGLGAIAPIFVVRFVLTMASYGCGAPGGIFAPLLVLGAQIGLAIGIVGHHLAPEAIHEPIVFAMVGMAAYFTAIVRAPLTGIVLMVEMTGDYGMVLPLVVACVTAYGIADALGDRPIYEALLERDLERSQEPADLDGTLLVEVTILPGAAFDGRLVRELGLPAGCVLVAVERAGDEQVPHAEMRLQAGDRVTAIVERRSPDAVPRLRRGATTPNG